MNIFDLQTALSAQTSRTRLYDFNFKDAALCEAGTLLVEAFLAVQAVEAIDARDISLRRTQLIQALTKETNTTIDIDDDGTIRIAATSGEAAQLAVARIEAITKDVEPGALYDGRVAKITDFGAFVTIAPGKDGLVHISQLADRRVERVSDIVKEGDTVRVRVLEVARDGKIRLSMRPGDLE